MDSKIETLPHNSPLSLLMWISFTVWNGICFKLIVLNTLNIRTYGWFVAVEKSGVEFLTEFNDSKLLISWGFLKVSLGSVKVLIYRFLLSDVLSGGEVWGVLCKAVGERVCPWVLTFVLFSSIADFFSPGSFLNKSQCTGFRALAPLSHQSKTNKNEKWKNEKLEHWSRAFSRHPRWGFNQKYWPVDFPGFSGRCGRVSRNLK